MKKAVRRTILFLVFFALILGGYFGLRIWASSKVRIPDSFSSARGNGAVISQDIVNLSNEVDADLQKINDLDKARKYKEAYLLSVKDVEKVSEIRKRALDLGEELKKMTAALPDVSPAEARQAGLDSISNRLALISRLISYTDKVSHLLDVLQQHFKTTKAPEEDIQRLVNEINAEVRSINAFNSQAGQAMDRFDQIIK